MSRQRSVWTFRHVLVVIFCWRRWSGWAVAGVVRPAEETGERRDGLEQQRVEFGLLVGGVLGVEAGDEPVPLDQGLVLVLGGLPAGLRSLPATSAAPQRE
jgi:hypothetical protein